MEENMCQVNMHMIEYSQKKSMDLSAEFQKQEIKREADNIRMREAILLKLWSDNIVPTVYRGEDGYIWLLYGKGKERYFAQRLLDVENLVIKEYQANTCYGVKSMLFLSWNSRGASRKSFFSKEIEVKDVFRELEKKGMKVLVKNYKTVEHALYSFFIKEAKVEEIPYKWGWNKFTNGDWGFCDSKKNMEEIHLW